MVARLIYTAFDFARLHADLAKYEVWPQANTVVIDAANGPLEFVATVRGDALSGTLGGKAAGPAARNGWV